MRDACTIWRQLDPVGSPCSTKPQSCELNSQPISLVIKILDASLMESGAQIHPLIVTVLAFKNCSRIASFGVMRLFHILEIPNYFTKASDALQSLKAA